MTRTYHEVEKTGSLNRVKLKTASISPLVEDQVLVEVKSVGLNYADIFAILGLYSATPKGAFTPGLEFSGVVVESRDRSYRAGDKVIGVTRFGGYTSHIIADPAYLMPLPAGWTFDEGAAFPVQTLTAYYALKTLGDIRQGQTVLIHSAAGGVGLQANRIAKRFNAFTIGVVGSEAKFDLLKKEGFDRYITRGKNFKEELHQTLIGRELHLVLEATGGKYFRYSYDALAPMGRIIAYGSAQFTPSSKSPNYLDLFIRYIFRPRVDPLSMIKANKSLMAFNLIWLYEKKSLMKQLLDEINELNLPAPVVGHRFAFNDAIEALDFFRSGKSTGKIVLTCE